MSPRKPLLAALCAAALLCTFKGARAQYPNSCASVGSRANSNGQANSCPANGGAIASNFNLTAYAALPGGSKTGNLTLTYAGSTPTLTPYAITRVWLTSGTTSLTTVVFGPPSPPTVSGGNTSVSYCFYGSNLATIGTLSFEMTNPQTGVVAKICSYDASCSGGCAVVANPATLPVSFAWFKVLETTTSSVGLGWATGQEQNNKGFEVQRSSQDSNFTTIAFVSTANPGGNSSNTTQYSFTDNNPPAGRIQYRLRQIDLDSRYTYSPVVSADRANAAQQPEMYGAHDHIVISLQTSTASSFDALVYDTQGRVLQRRHLATPGTYTITNLPTRHLYYVALQAQDGSKQTKPIYLY